MMGTILFFRYRRFFPTLLAMVSNDSKSTHACRIAARKSLENNLFRFSSTGELATLPGRPSSRNLSLIL